jgi:integrase
MSHGLSHGARLSQRGSVYWMRVKLTATRRRLEISLKTQDRVEARRRAARVDVALPLGPTPATVRAWIEAMERISMGDRPARAKAAAEIELDAAARRQALDPLDDPEFRAALEAEAEARGWYGKPDADEVIEHFWAMQSGMDAMTEAYHDACKRKGIDPATRKVVARAAASFKDLANRYVRARTEGFACKRRIETKDAGAGRAFVQGQSGNFLGSIALFLDYLGGAEITEQLCADFVSDLAKLPQKHGKGKDRVGMRRAIQDAEDEELVKIETVRSQLLRAKAPEGVIEDAVAARRIPRLKTATVVRHARAIAAILDWGVALEEIPSNPMRLVIPSSQELSARTRREVSGKRFGWEPEECNRLFRTPLFVKGPSHLDDALFWAPLIAAHSGMRAEEILQLKGTDIADGWIHVRITDPATQSAKTAPSLRQVPIHSNLAALGLDELARRAGSGRLFPRVKRSAARSKLSETFSKRFGYYRRKYHETPHDLPNKDFHSFRHGALTTMVNAGETLETGQQILGHESDEVTIVHYYDGATERMLRRAVEKIVIDVSGVIRVFG